MLSITVSAEDFYDEIAEEFVEMPAVTMVLEHSLVSLSKWEQSFEKPFLGDGKKTTEETMKYVEFMCLTPNTPPEVFSRLSEENYKTINVYLERKMTATWFNEREGVRRQGEIITAEIIYYWMIALNVPFECQYWHLNSLLTLIKVCNQKNQPAKKMNRGEAIAQRDALNEQRKAMHNTSG